MKIRTEMYLIYAWESGELTSGERSAVLEGTDLAVAAPRCQAGSLSENALISILGINMLSKIR